MTIDQQIAAAIDLGSNTFRLLVAAWSPGKIKVLEKRLITVRLGQDLAQNHLLHPHTMEKGLEVLRSFRKTLDNHPVQSIRICGTEALRQAQNSRSFLLQAEEILHNQIDIISGEEEARLSLAGALSDCNGLSGTALLADVGGGSTELIYTDTFTGQTRVESIGLGVVGLTEKFLAAPQHDIAAMEILLADKIGNALEKLNISDKNHPITILGCGGTATSLAALDLNLDSYSESLVHGHILHYRNLEQLWSRLITISAKQRNRIPCLGEGRGEILPAGLRIYQTLLLLLRQDRIRVSDTGLLEGILLTSVPDIS